MLQNAVPQLCLFLITCNSYMCVLLVRLIVFQCCKKHITEESKSTNLSIHLPKQLSETRWSCRANATKAVNIGYNAYLNALEEIRNDIQEKALVRTQAGVLWNKMQTVEYSFLLVFWNDLLESFNATSHILQDTSMDLNTAIASLDGLYEFVQ